MLLGSRDLIFDQGFAGANHEETPLIVEYDVSMWIFRLYSILRTANTPVIWQKILTISHF